MRQRSIAVLDIRSSEICGAVAEKGVNNTFIIKGKTICAYDGYAEGELLDIDNFNKVIADVIRSTFAPYGGYIKDLFISVPAEFSEVRLTDKVLTFSGSQTISRRHVSALDELSQPADEEGMTVVKSGALYYVLSDNRNIIDPVGSVSDSLRGRLSFYVAKTAFLECTARAIGKCISVRNFHWIPEIYSQSMYLLKPSVRDGRALIMDIGNISSSFSVVCGNGVEFSDAFSVGVGHIALLLMENLNIPYDVADHFIRSVNLNAKGGFASVEEYRSEGKFYSFRTSELRDIINEGLDGLCGIIEECRQAYVGKDISSKPIYLTGEGVGAIRGLTERISSRLVVPVEVVAPKVPYYDKPQFSSLFSLMAAAFDEKIKFSIF